MGSSTLTYGSLFSGIGGFDLGFDCAGMECTWQVEYDAKARSVLGRHWPNVERFEDVRNVGRDNLRPVDLICGGFPCQDVSVAGNRAGLAGERSGLWFEFHRILDELRPRWVVIENVPGLLSSNGGRDFATVLRGLVELRYGVTWRVLDSQYFGVAQRRRRVFIVGHLGDGRSAEVLFEPTSVSRRPPARREKRQGASRDIAPSIVSNGDAGSGFRDEKGLVLHQDTGYTVSAFDKQRISEYGSSDVSSTVSARDYKGATDLVVFQQNQRNEARDQGDVVGSLGTQAGMKQQNYLAYSLTTEQTPKYTADLAMTLTKGSSTGGGQPQAVAFNLYGGNKRKDRPDGGFYVNETEQAKTLDSTGLSGEMAQGGTLAIANFDVRRLTPTECERLQAFPDGWTDGQSDGARYKQLGNAVTVSVARWIGNQIMQFRKEVDSE